jgi:DNA-binding phage protein
MPKEAQTYPEMVESERERKSTSKLYKAQSAQFTGEQLSKLIHKTTAELVDAVDAEPVSLKDTMEVKRRSVVYLRACEAASSFPSMMGLARSLGVSRQALYDTIWRKSPPETAAWLTMCRDAFSDVLAESSLKNNCNSVVSIFLQKALYEMRESVEIVAKAEMPLGTEPDRKALEDKIINSIVCEEDFE